MAGITKRKSLLELPRTFLKDILSMFLIREKKITRDILLLSSYILEVLLYTSWFSKF